MVFDIETTGFSPEKTKIIEIGAVKVENGVITDKYSTFVNTDVPIPFEIEQLTDCLFYTSIGTSCTLQWNNKDAFIVLLPGGNSLRVFVLG